MRYLIIFEDHLDQETSLYMVDNPTADERWHLSECHGCYINDAMEEKHELWMRGWLEDQTRIYWSEDPKDVITSGQLKIIVTGRV